MTEPAAVGRTLGPYVVESVVGSGGMTRRLLWSHLATDARSRGVSFHDKAKRNAPDLSSTVCLSSFGNTADRRHPHVLRHSIAVHLMNAGCDAADVQDCWGHRDVASTLGACRDHK